MVQNRSKCVEHEFEECGELVADFGHAGAQLSKWYGWPPHPPERHTAKRRGLGAKPAEIGTVRQYSQRLLELCFT